MIIVHKPKNPRRKFVITATIYDKRGRVVAKATNDYTKTHPLQKQWGQKVGKPDAVYLHAEIAALIKARGKGHRIHVERYDAHGNPALAKPCKICNAAIMHAGIAIISYTTGNNPACDCC